MHEHIYNSRLDLEVEVVKPITLCAQILYGRSCYLMDADGNVYRALHATVKSGRKYYNLSSNHKLRAVQADFLKSLYEDESR